MTPRQLYVMENYGKVFGSYIFYTNTFSLVFLNDTNNANSQKFTIIPYVKEQTSVIIFKSCLCNSFQKNTKYDKLLQD